MPAQKPDPYVPSRNSRIIIGETIYDFVSPLGGRGQAGRAGFYSSDGGEHVKLIKEDAPGTCLAEGMVICYNPLPEIEMAEPIIQATAGMIMIDGAHAAVSIQARYSPPPGEVIMPFDQFILGHKRVPNTMVSEEWQNSRLIKEKISALSLDVKMQLANAIYTSQLNGDESLHTGQFMISVNKDNLVVSSIRRIDFGALGRYAMARDQFDPLHTSKQYGSSGQFGKDYVSYLLQDDVVKQHVLKLWTHTDTALVVQQVDQRFTHQVACIEGPLKDMALKEFDGALTKKSSTPLAQSGDIEGQVRSHLLQATEARCNGMKASANLNREHSKSVLDKHDFKNRFKELRTGSTEPASSKEKAPSTFMLRNL
ncbi:MAG TPA: hypothetical protein DDY37_02810 [Legionella sp.]|nr:hypothetical protein [Legionella sp.]